MKDLRNIAVVNILLILLASCNFGRQDTASEQKMRIVEIDKDSMQYGVCLELHGSDSMLYLMDEGDTLWLQFKDDAIRIGELEPDARVAIITTTGHTQKVSLCINTSMLMGRWVQPDAVAEGSLRGFMLAEGGAAQSINISDINYDNWRISNGKLLLDISYVDGFGQNYTDTFSILRLTNDSLWLRGQQRLFLHRLSNNETADATASYTVDPESGMDFSPELDEQDIVNNSDISDDDLFFNPDYDVAP